MCDIFVVSIRIRDNNHHQYRQKVEGEDPQVENPLVGQDSTDDSNNKGGGSSSGLPVSSA